MNLFIQNTSRLTNQIRVHSQNFVHDLRIRPISNFLHPQRIDFLQVFVLFHTIRADLPGGAACIVSVCRQVCPEASGISGRDSRIQGQGQIEFRVRPIVAVESLWSSRNIASASALADQGYLYHRLGNPRSHWCWVGLFRRHEYIIGLAVFTPQLQQFGSFILLLIPVHGVPP